MLKPDAFSFTDFGESDEDLDVGVSVCVRVCKVRKERKAEAGKAEKADEQASDMAYQYRGDGTGFGTQL